MDSPVPQEAGQFGAGMLFLRRGPPRPSRSVASGNQSGETFAAAASSTSTRSRKRTAEEMEDQDTLPGFSHSSPPTMRRHITRSKAPFARSGNLKAPPPAAKPSKDEYETDEDSKKPAATDDSAENCCICMSDVEPEDLSLINGCVHKFCFECIDKWSERENTCPLCKERFSKIDRVCKKRKKGVKISKKVRQRDQRSDQMPGAAIEGLLASLSSRGGGGPASIARIFFGVPGQAGNGHGMPPPPFAAGLPLAGSSAGSPLELLDSDDDEESPFSLFRSLASNASTGPPRRGSATLRMSFTGGPNARFTLTSASPLSNNPLRSHASNANDATAGHADNPLEIDLDSSDDEVEIIAVRSSRRASSRLVPSRPARCPSTSAASSRPASSTPRPGSRSSSSVPHAPDRRPPRTLSRHTRRSSRFVSEHSGFSSQYHAAMPIETSMDFGNNISSRNDDRP